ncbi:EVE domain-containing protein [Candidatus Saccharibacteria bacterium]|nr:EVE domain-containing protein [Candidatus Saccharibacteria bacterium]MCB9821069.1 EVE domain-containing protein [Candidatus Nomurabacteria bacterium]
MEYWLVKADPETDYSIDDLKRDKHTVWDGVHNFAAIGHIKRMNPGDFVYIYHSQKAKSIVGMAEVSGNPFENHDDPRPSWAVELTFVKKTRPVTLQDIKNEPICADWQLVRNSRLSVMPVPRSVNTWLEQQTAESD